MYYPSTTYNVLSQYIHYWVWIIFPYKLKNAIKSCLDVDSALFMEWQKLILKNLRQILDTYFLKYEAEANNIFPFWNTFIWA